MSHSALLNDTDIFVCMQTNSTCYRQTRVMNVLGVLWHSTGANNPYIKRYVQPTDGSANYSRDIAKLGKNTNGNDWNHIYVEAGLNAWIGKFADESVGICQSMPWNYRPWGCGGGSKGSCNNGWIQFEICEDNLQNKSYAEKVWNAAVRLTAYLCKVYDLNPKGYQYLNGVRVPVITCHNDAYKLGVGSGHSDINHWFPKILGKDMDDVREEVAYLLEHDMEFGSANPDNSTLATSKPSTPSNNSNSNTKPSASQSSNTKVTVLSGKVKVDYANGVNVRESPSLDGKINQVVKKGTFTVVGITSDKEWYKLKSGLYITTSTKYVKFTPDKTQSQTQTYKVDSAKSKDASIAGTYKAIDDVNMRTGAGTNNQIILEIPKGGKVKCYGYYTTISNGKWYLVQYNGKTGFVASNYLKKI